MLSIILVFYFLFGFKIGYRRLHILVIFELMFVVWEIVDLFVNFKILFKHDLYLENAAYGYTVSLYHICSY